MTKRQPDRGRHQCRRIIDPIANEQGGARLVSSRLMATFSSGVRPA
jgi:hypothetical protein